MKFYVVLKMGPIIDIKIYKCKKNIFINFLLCTESKNNEICINFFNNINCIKQLNFERSSSSNECDLCFGYTEALDSDSDYYCHLCIEEDFINDFNNLKLCVDNLIYERNKIPKELFFKFEKKLNISI